uniref:Uncharacterized protein n=1 Tax=Monilinia benyvirus C TaxID=2592780 RepID=A0A7G3KJP0_9VIRU|nr:hypothetical protein [Monilinia benyvirus C]QED42945.1 hypothetical protein [Monilinia benyvirus C]
MNGQAQLCFNCGRRGFAFGECRFCGHSSTTNARFAAPLVRDGFSSGRNNGVLARRAVGPVSVQRQSVRARPQQVRGCGCPGIRGSPHRAGCVNFVSAGVSSPQRQSLQREQAAVPLAGALPARIRWPSEAMTSRVTLGAIAYSGEADSEAMNVVIGTGLPALQALFSQFDLVKITSASVSYETLLAGGSSTGGQVRLFVREEAASTTVADLAGITPTFTVAVGSSRTAGLLLGGTSAFEGYVVGNSPAGRGRRSGIRVVAQTTLGGGTGTGSVGQVVLDFSWLGRRGPVAGPVVPVLNAPVGQAFGCVLAGHAGLVNATTWNIQVRVTGSSLQVRRSDGTWVQAGNATWTQVNVHESELILPGGRVNGYGSQPSMVYGI